MSGELAWLAADPEKWAATFAVVALALLVAWLIQEISDKGRK